jgi:hypothetical protein
MYTYAFGCAVGGYVTFCRVGYWRGRAPLVAALTCVASLSALARLAPGADAPPAKSAAPKTIGLAVTDWSYALVETPDAKEECSLGLQAGEVAQFKAQPDYLEHRQKFGGTFENRGPNGEKGNFSPTVVQDVLPWSELVTKRGYGMNLDGTSDGHATPKSCKHEKFTSDDGQQVDNQMARVIGCIQGFRTSGLTGTFYRNEVPNFTFNRHLIEITGVDSESNDPDVQVSIYKGMDQLVKTAGGDGFVPFTSQRIDVRYPQFIMKTHGRIVDGVLITDPIPYARFPIRETGNVGERRMHDLTLRLKLTSSGAEGLLAGYEDTAAWWNIKSKGVTPELDKYSPAGMYRALHRHADGYPDPATGQCTAISAAYNIKAVPVIVIHPTESQQHLAARVN